MDQSSPVSPEVHSGAMSRRRTGLAVLIGGAITLGLIWSLPGEARAAGYGVGDSLQIEDQGFIEPVPYAKLLSPALALCNREVKGCPPPVAHGGGYLPPTKLTADAPHLRLHLILRETGNTPVAGGGLTLVAAKWKASTSAWVSWPGHDWVILVMQAPGQTWEANAWMFQGVKVDGCLGPSQEFDIELKNELFQGGAGVGSLTVSDDVVGTGSYVFEYTVRGTGADGAVSDFTFRGDAYLFCSGDSSVI